MTPSREVTNHAASVKQKLLNRARADGTDFNLVFQRYIGERFLYRLGLTAEVDRFTLKGATLFLIWAGTQFRPTRDVDLLGNGPADHSAIRNAIDTVCAVEFPQDGLRFDTKSITVEDIGEDQEYRGVRVKLRVYLERANLPLQIDIGFGDAITPERQEAEYPALLDLPAPRVWAYPRETSVAEKFEAMVRLGPANSRMKDFWDLAAFAAQFDFDGETLRSAVDETFRRRGTSFGEDLPDALRPAFYEDEARVRSWQAFQGIAGAVVDVPAGFEQVGELVGVFLGPIRESVIAGQPFTLVWPRGGPWRPQGPGEEVV